MGLWRWNYNIRRKLYYSYGYAMKGQSIDVIFVATDEVLCSDSTTRTVDINNLQAALGYRPQPVYRGGLVDFEDLSVSDYDNIILGTGALKMVHLSFDNYES
jgi:hypothetical protein